MNNLIFRIEEIQKESKAKKLSAADKAMLSMKAIVDQYLVDVEKEEQFIERECKKCKHDGKQSIFRSQCTSCGIDYHRNFEVKD